MTRKSGTKWEVIFCPQCLNNHKNYSGKLDRDNAEYVICGSTQKKIYVRNSPYVKKEI